MPPPPQSPYRRWSEPLTERHSTTSFNRLNSRNNQNKENQKNFTKPKDSRSSHNKNTEVGHDWEILQLTLKLNIGSFQMCGFCKNNGAAPEIYGSHSLKDGSGLVQCPRLRSFICPMCGSTGDYAHTKSHCPSYKIPI